MSSSLGTHIKLLRTSFRKSLRQVEAETGISNAHLSQIEKGTIEKPSEEILKKLSSYFLVELEYLKSLAGYSKQEKEEIDSKIIPFRYLTATQLKTFAKTPAAAGLLPALVRHLIVSTVNHDFLEMSIEESVYMHGWDGLLECKNKPSIQFVPEGFSCWEMTKRDDIKKAEDDFSKRTKKPLGQTIQNSTYIHVTLGELGKAKKARFIEESKKSSGWKDVKVIDAEDLELWLEKSPVVALVYAKKMGFFPNADGLIPLIDSWEEWWRATDPAIDENLLLEAGKRCTEAQLFTKDPSMKHLKIKSSDDKIGIAYFYALLSNFPNKVLSQSLISRSIIVTNENAFRSIMGKSKGLIMIPTFKGAPIGDAKSKGHQIVSIVSEFHPNDLDVIARVHTSVMTNFLKIEAGYSEEKAYKTAKLCHGNLMVLRALLADEGEIISPLWASSAHAHTVLPLAMLGGWEGSNEYDKEIIKKLTNKSYDDIKVYLSTLPKKDADSLFQKVEQSYSFHQEYSYLKLARFIEIKDIENFFLIAQEVLSEINSTYELKSEERPLAYLHKKGHRYSTKLRMGIATTLAMLATIGASHLPALQSAVDRIVQKILTGNPDWKFWASLGDILTLLAEASPDAFLNELEKVCQKEEFIEILNQASTFGGCDYAAILFSLELCAWDKKYFKQASRILLLLAENENTKSNYVNKPSNSLWDIYRLWANQSSVPFKERLDILRELEEISPRQVWKLLLRMLPLPHEVGDYTYRPKFREITPEAHDKDGGLSYFTAVNALVEYILSFLAKDSKKWIRVIDLIFNIRPVSCQLKLIVALLNTDFSRLPVEVSTKIWRKLENKLARHLEFPDAEWSVKGESLIKLGEAYRLFRPQDPLSRWAHIFSPNISHPEIEDGDHDYDKKQEKIKALQKKALKELISSQDNLGVITQLLSEVPSPRLFGIIFAEVYGNWFLEAVAVAKEHKYCEYFINGMVFSLYESNGDEWLDKILQTPLLASGSIRENIYLSLPYKKRVWERVECEPRNVQENFWKNINLFYLQDSIEDTIYIANKFMEYDRPIDAFYVMANFEQRGKVHLPSDLIMKVIDRVMSFDLSKIQDKVDFTLFEYHLENILRELSLRIDVDKRKLAMIEWNFLPLLQHRKAPEHLAIEVNEDPSLFVDILKLAYKRDDHTMESDISQEVARRAYSFFINNKQVPGIDKEGKFERDSFHKWFFKARTLALGCDRSKAFDSVIGQLLAYSPSDPEDKNWPHKAVREVFEKYGSDEMDEGFSSGIFNKRGVFSRSSGEGGDQERELAKKYEEYAKKTEISWPRVSKILRNVSLQYKAYAQREDLHEIEN